MYNSVKIVSLAIQNVRDVICPLACAKPVIMTKWCMVQPVLGHTQLNSNMKYFINIVNFCRSFKQKTSKLRLIEQQELIQARYSWTTLEKVQQ